MRFSLIISVQFTSERIDERSAAAKDDAQAPPTVNVSICKMIRGHSMRLAMIMVFMGALSSPIVAAETEQEKALKHIVGLVFPDLEVTRIKKSQIAGLYEVMLGPEVLYISNNGRYVLQGDIIDLQSRTNMSEVERAAARVQILKNIPEDETINFSPDNARHTIYVFTDITCGYCRQLHRDMPELNKNGVAIRYLAYPRAGMGSQPFKDMESIWCAEDKLDAMTAAKLRGAVKAARCDNPVKEQYELGKLMGIRGTPAIYLENGEDLPGYLPPELLLQALGEI